MCTESHIIGTLGEIRVGLLKIMECRIGDEDSAINSLDSTQNITLL